jgi:predicted metal-binding membrane protein
MRDGGASMLPQAALEDPSARASAISLRIEPAAAWGVLLGLAAIGWVVMIVQAGSMRQMAGMPNMPDMPAASPPVLVFLALWTAMMAAMMFPSVAPVATALAVAGRGAVRAGGRTFVFLAGYLAVWVLFGTGAYVVARVLPGAGMAGSGLLSSNVAAGASLLMFAGLYEWSPVKMMCLDHCRAPQSRLDRRRPSGMVDAVRSGIIYGAQCVGCSGALMLVLFAVGLMNLGWMALLAAVIFVEKVFPRGPFAVRVAGAALVASGIALLAVPGVARILG